MRPAPSEEQAAVLDNASNARIRVVRSAPGSGKTWLVAEEMRRSLRGWKAKHEGIAALSFTNVANQEIREALGASPAHPHFTGTLDAFIFRYITQPFHLLHPGGLPPLQLIPAERAKAMGEAQQWTRSSLNFQVGATAQEHAHLFLVDAFGMDGGEVRFAAKWRPSGREEIPSCRRAAVTSAKRQAWRKGFISHSDNALIAFEILQNRGAEVRKLLLRRFSILIVDEFQDTGWFHGQILLNLFGDISSRGMIVGDPDQAIYEFNGATPALFESALSLPGAEGMDLPTSRRCPELICSIAQGLRSSGGALRACDSRPGEASLIEVPSAAEGASRILAAARAAFPNGKHVVLCRENTIVDACVGSSLEPGDRPGSPILKALHDAVLDFRGGKAKPAIESAESALLRAAFGSGVLRRTGSASENWRQGLLRRAAMRLLLEGHRSIEGESLLDWGNRMKERIHSVVHSLEISGLPDYTPQTVRAFRSSATSTVPAFPSTPPTDPETIGRGSVRTIHGAKGETHSTTILCLPDPTTRSRCISHTWWSSESRHLEERRIAYVAMTRTNRRLILCVGPATLSRLRESRPAFVDQFRMVSMDRLEEAFPQG
jgi:DNA helicase-2/ATP-dependent DNA helicase PcrA